MKNFALLLLSCSMLISACKKEDDDVTEVKVPVVFVHGLLASGDTYANQAMRFTSNGFPADLLFAFDYESLNFFGASALDTAGLDDFIDAVRQKTGAEKVNLVGHSLGGSTGYQYLKHPAHAAKVAHYVHVGSSVPDSVAFFNFSVPILNVYSIDDMVTLGGDIPGATNVALAGKDHYEVATCEEAFEVMYRFFNENKSPATLAIVQKSSVKISGKVISLGENKPKPNAEVKVFRVNALSGERLSTTPDFTLSINQNGEWGPNEVTPGAYYEFEVNPNDNADRMVHYYYEGFTHDNPFVYLRLLPPATGLTASLVNELPKDDQQSVVVLFTANQAVITGRDSLSMNGVSLSIQDFCSPEDNTIAFFIYDNGDYQTDVQFSSPPFFTSFPFLQAADIFLPTTDPQSIQCRFNGRNLFVRNWKSESEGVSIAVFN